MSFEFDDHFRMEIFCTTTVFLEKNLPDPGAPKEIPPFQGPWQNWPVDGIPDVNGDGKSDFWDLVQIINRKAKLTAPDGSGGIYHPQTNAVVLYIEKDKEKTPVGRYDYDTKEFSPPTSPSPYIDKPDGFFGM